MKFVLRPYQETAIRRVYARLAEGRRAPLLVAPTGAGKTVMAARIIEDFARRGIRTLFVAHRTELIEQPSRKLDECGIEHGIIKAGLDRGTRREMVQVASVQTYVAREKYLKHNFGLIIIDESHHAAATTYQRVLDANGRPPVIGLTATPYRTDGKGLCDVFDALEVVTTTAQLMRDGYLVPVKLYRGTLPIELRGIKTVAGDYDEGELGAAMARPKLIGHALAEYTRLAYGRRAIGFCVNVAHSKACAEAFNAAGIVAEHIDGLMARAERAAILRRYHEGRTLVVFNCGVLTEGYDESRIEAVLGLRPTKSRGLWRQIVGRGLRLCPELGKQHCAILDHANWTAEHGYITDPDDVSLAAGIQRGQQRGEYEREEATGTEDVIGLGDARVSLAEDPLAFIQGPRISTALPPPIVRPPASKPQIMRRYR